MRKPNKSKRSTQRAATHAARKAKGRKQDAAKKKVASDRELARKREQGRKRLRHARAEKNLSLSALAADFASPSRFGMYMIDVQHDFREGAPFGSPKSPGAPGTGKIGSPVDALIVDSFLNAMGEPTGTLVLDAMLNRLDRT